MVIPVLESGGSELGRLAVFLRLHRRVVGALVEEICECLLLVSEALLQGNAGHLVEIGPRRVFLQCGQLGAGFLVANARFLLLKRLGTPGQDRVVDGAHTAERPRQQVFLLGRRIEAVFECAFRLHALTVCIFSERINPR
ncbi:hypothetical protein D3C78_1345370 [compost metagenome]